MNKYTINELIGEGSFGEVYLAKNNDTNEIVAIKQFQLRNRNGGRHEIAILKQIPVNIHLPRFIDSFDKNGNIFIVSNFIKGEELTYYQASLSTLERRDSSMIPTVNALATQMLDALKALHSSGIVHRDVKQENIIFDPATITFVLIDVGGSCDSKGCFEPAGTTELMSPDLVDAYERFNNGQGLFVDTEVYKKGDVYALGVVLYEFVEDHPPYKNLSRREQTRYRVYDFDEPIEVTYNDPKLNGIITNMLSCKYDADDMIYQFTKCFLTT